MEIQQIDQEKTHHTSHEQEYNSLKIPCDWNLARRHALAHRTAPDTKDDDLNKKRNDLDKLSSSGNLSLLRI